jgi:hypothetical protein
MSESCRCKIEVRVKKRDGENKEMYQTQIYYIHLNGKQRKLIPEQKSIEVNS